MTLDGPDTSLAFMSARELTYCFLRLGTLDNGAFERPTTPHYGSRRPRRSFCFKQFDADK